MIIKKNDNAIGVDPKCVPGEERYHIHHWVRFASTYVAHTPWSCVSFDRFPRRRLSVSSIERSPLYRELFGPLRARRLSRGGRGCDSTIVALLFGRDFYTLIYSDIQNSHERLLVRFDLWMVRFYMNTLWFQLRELKIYSHLDV